MAREFAGGAFMAALLIIGTFLPRGLAPVNASTAKTLSNNQAEVLTRDRDDRLATPCAAGHDIRWSDLCAQWKAADAASAGAWWAGAQFWLGLVGLVVGSMTFAAAAYAALYARRAADETRRSADEAEKSVVEAKRSADAAERSVAEQKRISEAQARAYLEVRSVSITIRPDLYIELFCKIKNVGASRASRVSVKIKVLVHMVSGADHHFDMQTATQADILIPSKAKVTLPRFVSKEPLKQSDLDRQLINQKPTVYMVSALITYKDIFDSFHTEKHGFSNGIGDAPIGGKVVLKPAFYLFNWIDQRIQGR